MSGEIVYLDTSAIVKRYVDEPGSDVVRGLYRRCYLGELRISFNLWNIGEVLGVIDRARILRRIREEDYVTIKRRFLAETIRLMRLGILLIVGIRRSILKDSWRLIERYRVYQADALQVVSAKNVRAEQFFVADRKLHEVALKEGLNSVYLG
ncbi:MAG: type II toxin-antitoxin system VapC family toxin [Nitrososphaerota archaeon]|nr:type II toxin-antitoxin system VapC family toxin [Candidatus Bathyarchaeota archaeon]MCX8161603.1 type II toxin-antitoxin system VapC family toxin [Candidatus Bathyarchaeota archaeon]MDW8061639.1 type II toxin-antitoxin system VapC family toxin [Nitrososphaerota archaeon]